MAHSAETDTGRQLGTSGARAPWASIAESSRGRLVAEPASASRSPFQRDRDRIVHCTAFRRLTYKTQVFVYHEGDHYRSRLTHSLEVAQIARSIARTLRLDEDLAETIALAHDLGHTPFGHAGEQALDRAMAGFGGFDHNAQSLRIVTRLERRYAAFDGLNLTWETLEGLVKHNGPWGQAPHGGAPGVPAVIADYCAGHDLELATFPSGEAQVAALADDIAYNNHDIDDGMRAGLCSLAALREIPLTGRLIDEIHQSYPRLEEGRLTNELNRRLITAMVNDTVAETRLRVAETGAGKVEDIRSAGRAVVGFSPALDRECEALRAYLFAAVYRNARVARIMDDAKRIVADLFTRYMDDPSAMPPDWRARGEKGPPAALARQVCDFIAGMTDRYAHEEHRRLFDDTPELR